MPRISLFLCLSAAAFLSNAAITFAAPGQGHSRQSTRPNAPLIAKVTRSPRKDGVWQDIFVIYAGKASQKLTLRVHWDAHTLAENSRGTVCSKSILVRTDAKGHGNWKMTVRGYPAGKMRARVTNDKRETGKESPVFDVPWLY